MLLTISKLLTALLSLVLAVLVHRLFIRKRFAATSNLPRVKRTNWFWGNVKELVEDEPPKTLREWEKQLGHTFMFDAILGQDRLFTSDPKALNHILVTHAYDYPKPALVRRMLAELLGEGVLIAEGERHKRQRKVMGPSFAVSHIRALTPLFLAKSRQLRDVWQSILRTQSEQGTKAGSWNVMPFISSLTLDIIGLAGFDYAFDALPPPQDPHAVNRNILSEAFQNTFEAGAKPSPLRLLTVFIPPLAFIPTSAGRAIKHGLETMNVVGKRLLEEKKAAVRQAQELGEECWSKDLISLLVRANMAPDLKESERLSDDEVLGQITTFMLAGHETTSTSMTWTLYLLARHVDVQTRLRDELLAAGVDSDGNIGMDELNALPYLDKVCKESLRLHAPVPDTARVAAKPDTIPLSRPTIDPRTGTPIHAIRVDAGQNIMIPIAEVLQNPDVWGDDAGDFKPDRWDSPPNGGMGVWAGLLTFLAGPHACIGFRFSIIELKSILFVLLRSFAFALPDPVPPIRVRADVVSRPLIRGQEGLGYRMDLVVKELNDM